MSGFHSHDDDFLYEFQRASDFVKNTGEAAAENAKNEQPEEIDGGIINYPRIYVQLSPTQLASLKRIARLRRTSVSVVTLEAIEAVLKKSI
jgi:hypothetical protein